MSSIPSMTRRHFLAKSALATGALLGAGSLLEACGSSASSTKPQAFALNVFTWFGADNTTAIPQINNGFHSAHSNVTIKWSNYPTEQYDTVLRTRIAAGNAPDVMALLPGTYVYPYSKAKNILDLSQEPWAANVISGARGVASYHGKLYGLPLGEAVLGIVYNKQLFAKHGLSVPTTWDEFLQVCRTLKAAGVTPIAHGLKDGWLAQLIPYAMAPTSIYQSNPNFDTQMYDGSATFSNSNWPQMMQDYLALDKQGFFNKGSLGTTFSQTIQLVAAGTAAMAVNGNWMVASIQQANPNIQLGMFPLPYAQSGQSIWVPVSVSGLLGISATSKHIDVAKEYLQYWASSNNMRAYLTKSGNYSSMSNVTSDITGPAADMTPYLKVGTYNFLNQKWPASVADALIKGVQEVFSGTSSVTQMLHDMDTAFQSGKSQVL